VRSAMLVADNITWHLSADTPAVGKETRYFSITDSYVTPDDRLMAVFVAADRSGRNLKIGNPLALFRTNMVTAGAFGVVTVATGPKQQYGVADGPFFMIVPAAETATPSPISIGVNWPATLER
jgi:hypothetical protein